MEGLVVWIMKLWLGLYKVFYFMYLLFVMDIIFVCQLFFSVCFYVKFVFLMVNQVIFDVMEGEKVVYIVDLEVLDFV